MRRKTERFRSLRARQSPFYLQIRQAAVSPQTYDAGTEHGPRFLSSESGQKLALSAHAQPGYPGTVKSLGSLPGQQVGQ